jgi:hypothetical protein
MKPKMLSSDNNPISQWNESFSRLQSMIEILAYFDIPPITIRFVNRPMKIILEKDTKMTPTEFIKTAKSKIAQKANFFNNVKKTDLIWKLLKSFNKQKEGTCIIRYIFIHGEPAYPIRVLLKILKQRSKPESNSISIICSDWDDKDKEMKERAAMIPNCIVSANYIDERAEVGKNQGSAFPFTYGFYLVTQLVSALELNECDVILYIL